MRGIYFDKLADANWAVPWHQDLTICVSERIETEGFGAWSVKEGVTHVQPPPAILEKMITLRLHLDDCGEDNGPLLISPGTHLMGRIPEANIQDIVSRHGQLACTVKAGGIVLMRPLTLHASRTSMRAEHRRVVHIEFAACELPNGLRWSTLAEPTPA